MATRNNEPPSQVAGDGGNSTPPAGQKADQAAATRAGNKVFKSGPLFISSKGIGWTSWKKRWFILTRTSLVFFRSDPNAVAQKGSEVNLTLGGIDLNNSGSVVVKADKKLLTVLFPDGRTFSLKAETMEDLYEWKNALDAALAQAPSATLVMGQNGMLGNDQTAAADGSTAQLKDKQNMKSMVIGRPVLLALEEVDGTPSFLEKALRFVEEHGAKTEGVLRQAADVDDVEYRIREYENGKNEFSPNEDAHIIGDCIKYVLRELPSSPVPASCCNALLEACKSDRERRINAMRTAICETFPEPNRRLLQRILIMMQKVAAHKAVNRMSPSAVAACMAPLLLRPLLSGECELEHDFDVGGDGSAQLLQAAAAANHAQSIVMTLLEEYHHIFGEGSLSPDIYSDSEESGSEGEEVTDDEYYEEDDEEEYEDEEDEEYEDEEESGIGTDDESENLSGESRSVYDDDDDEGTVHTRKEYDGFSSGSGSESPEVVDPQGGKVEPVMEDVKTKMIEKQRAINSQDSNNKSAELGQVQNSAAHSSSTSTMQKSSTISSGAAALRTYEGAGTDSPTDVREKQKPYGNILTATMNKSTSIAAGILNSGRRQVWGRTPAKKNPSMESVGSISEEDEIQKLEAAKADLENKIDEEAKENEILLANLECKKKSVFERRKALEQDVAKLQLQLQKERDLRRALEAGLKEPHKPLPFSATIDGKVKADLEELAAAEANINNLKKMVDDLGNQLDKQREENKSVSQQSSSKHTKVTSKDNESKNAHPDENPRQSKDSLDKNQTDGERNQESTSSSMNKSQAPSRKLDSVQSKKHQLPKRQLDSLSSKKHQPLSDQQQQDSTVSNKEEHQLPKRQLDSLSSKKHQPLSDQQHQQDSTVSNKEEHQLLKRQLDSLSSKKHQPLSDQQQQQQDSTVSNKEEHQLPKRQLDSLSSKKHQPVSHQQQQQDSTVSNKEEHPSHQLESVGTSKQQQQQPQNQNLDSVGSSKSKPGGQMSNPQGSDSGTVRDSAPVSSKEYDKRTEEHRMPNEFQRSSMEKGQQGLGQGVMSPEKSRGAESAQKPAISSSEDKVREGGAVPSYPDNNKKPKSDDLNRARASEGQSSSQDVDRKKK